MADSGIEVDEASSDDERARRPVEEELDTLRDWGTSRADYYNADTIETEADALEEEAEARRMQQKQLEGMTEADFGFDEQQLKQDGIVEDDDGQGTVTEKLPEIEIPADMPTVEKLKILKSRYPEFEPLAKDFVELRTVHAELKAAADAAQVAEGSSKKRKLKEMESKSNFVAPPVALIKFRSLSAYLGTIAIYFALLTSTSTMNKTSPLALAPGDLRDHPVIQTIVRCRQVWEEVRDIPIPEIEDPTLEIEPQIAAEGHITNGHDVNGVGKAPKPRRKRKSRAERAAIAAQAAAEAERAERIRRTEASLAELDARVPRARKSILKNQKAPVTAVNGDADSDFGDEAALTAQEAAEKAQKKKSLRFYTSQIAQKANKRGAAGRDAGGDEDLPHKERLRDRQARLAREAENRGKQPAKASEQLNDNDSGDEVEELRLAREIRGDGEEDEDGYYDMVTAKAKAKKADKKARADADAEAAKQGAHVYEQEEVGPDGKRAITYAIEKNKGLTPKRSKDVRNPRVKKRKKYEEKMKKLSSQRPVYKGGEGRGGYGGELTGIKMNLVKSVKL